jgi:hypothetical protein
MQTPSLLVVLVSLAIANGLTWFLTFFMMFLMTPLAESTGAAIITWILAPTPIAITSAMALALLLTAASTAPAPRDVLDALGSKPQCHVLIAAHFFLEELLFRLDMEEA